jgi:tripartite-type tricarboxylate transporter receptor subunit TctC
VLDPAVAGAGMRPIGPIYSPACKGEDADNENARENAMRTIVRCLVAVVAVFAASSAFAQSYPNKPVRVLVPFPPGGVTDIATRLIAQKLTERLKQNFYVDNISGAGGNLGMGQVAKAAGDGYTILVASSSIVVNPSLYKNITYDIDKDFIPVTKAGGTPNSWVVNPNFPAKTMRELVDLLKREPGKHSVGQPGTGTTPSLSIEMLKQELGLNFVTVPFKGGGPMTTSLLGGHTPIVCSALGNYVNHIKEGKIRALAITATKRSAALPDLPTLEELGIKGQEAETMTGVFVPAGTPKPVVDLLQREISAIVNSPDVKAKMLAAGIEAEGNSQADFAAYVRAEIVKWKRVIERAKIDKI